MKRVLLKLSGEALAEGGDGILNFDFVAKVGEVLKRCLDLGVEIGVIVGAGNIWRGRQGGKMNRVRADQMGMLATTINSLALQDTFIGMGIPTRVMTAFELNTVADPFSARHAIEHLQNGEIVIEGLRIGEYTVSEVANEKSENYVLPADKDCTIFEGATTKVEMHNELRDTPKTGDNSNPALWVALMGISGVAAIACAVCAYKKSRKK